MHGIYGNNGSTPTTLLTDAVVADVDTTIKAAIKSRKIEGAAAELLHYALRAKVVRDNSGGVMIAVDHFLDVERSPFGNDEWLQPHQQLHPLKDGIALLLSVENPELVGARRRFEVAEEERKAHVRSIEHHEAERLERAQQERGWQRVDAWRQLPREVRAAHRLGAKATALDLANALINEPQDGSEPPQTWEA